jgi:hypothetical protein
LGYFVQPLRFSQQLLRRRELLQIEVCLRIIAGMAGRAMSGQRGLNIFRHFGRHRYRTCAWFARPALGQAAHKNQWHTQPNERRESHGEVNPLIGDCA